jgi:hypothetical protein
MPETAIAQLLTSKEKALAGPTVAPQGLCLVRVAYAPGEFEAGAARASS